MLRRLLLTLCLFLALASAGLWVKSYFATDMLAYTSRPLLVRVRLTEGRMEIWCRCEPNRVSGRDGWALHHLPPGRGNLLDRGAANLYDLKAAWVQFPLWLPTLAFALLALWLWRRNGDRPRARGSR
jgi:hypothetical protein